MLEGDRDTTVLGTGWGQSQGSPSHIDVTHALAQQVDVPQVRVPHPPHHTAQLIPRRGQGRVTFCRGWLCPSWGWPCPPGDGWSLTHPSALRGSMMMGGPGGPRLVGKMSTHICTLPWGHTDGLAAALVSPACPLTVLTAPGASPGPLNPPALPSHHCGVPLSPQPLSLSPQPPSPPPGVPLAHPTPHGPCHPAVPSYSPPLCRCPRGVPIPRCRCPRGVAVTCSSPGWALLWRLRVSRCSGTSSHRFSTCRARRSRGSPEWRSEG